MTLLTPCMIAKNANTAKSDSANNNGHSGIVPILVQSIIGTFSECQYRIIGSAKNVLGSIGTFSTGILGTLEHVPILARLFYLCTNRLQITYWHAVPLQKASARSIVPLMALCFWHHLRLVLSIRGGCYNDRLRGL